MASLSTAIPIDHHPAIHEVPSSAPESGPHPFTLLELVSAVSEVSEDESEVVATVRYMLESGRVRLRGNFRDTPILTVAD